MFGGIMTKMTLSTEFGYILGILCLAMGTALMELADFGLSMVVAPAYLIYLKCSEIFPTLTFGTVEYLFQAFLLLVMIPVLRKFRISWLFSFVTAVLYGLALDACMLLAAALPVGHFALRLAWYLTGLLFCSAGVAMLFRSYLAPEVYELFVKELAKKTGKDIGKVKVGYDCVSCAVAVLLSFCFFGLWHFEGVKLGTILCAFVNGHIIGFMGRVMDKNLQWKDALPLRKYFEKGAEVC